MVFNLEIKWVALKKFRKLSIAECCKNIKQFCLKIDKNG